MKLFLLGATGGIGRHFVRLALERGHDVTAFARSPEKAGPPHPRLHAVRGDLFSAGPMAEALRGHDAVVSTFGPTTLRASTQRRGFGRALASALREGGVDRVQVISSGLLFPGLGLVPRLLKATLFRVMLPDMAAMEAEVMQDDLDWTVVRPPRLTDRPATQPCRAADGRLPTGMYAAREGVARFLLEEAEAPRHRKQIVGLGD